MQHFLMKIKFLASTCIPIPKVLERNSGTVPSVNIVFASPSWMSVFSIGGTICLYPHILFKCFLAQPSLQLCVVCQIAINISTYQDGSTAHPHHNSSSRLTCRDHPPHHQYRMVWPSLRPFARASPGVVFDTRATVMNVIKAGNSDFTRSAWAAEGGEGASN